MSVGEAVPTRVAKLALDPNVQHIDATFKTLADEVVAWPSFRVAVAEYACRAGVDFNDTADVVAAIRLLRRQRRAAQEVQPAASLERSA